MLFWKWADKPHNELLPGEFWLLPGDFRMDEAIPGMAGFYGLPGGWGGLTPLPEQEKALEPFHRIVLHFVPMMHPTEEGKIFVAEKATFNSLTDFLRTEFYRGLAMGNAPRRCHNCGRYFLLTNGYDTRYCNNIAPGETERTCRKVGAHRKAARNRGPADVEYQKVYNRLKRESRGEKSAPTNGTPPWRGRRRYWTWRSAGNCPMRKPAGSLPRFERSCHSLIMAAQNVHTEKKRGLHTHSLYLPLFEQQAGL